MTLTVRVTEAVKEGEREDEIETLALTLKDTEGVTESEALWHNDAMPLELPLGEELRLRETLPVKLGDAVLEADEVKEAQRVLLPVTDCEGVVECVALAQKLEDALLEEEREAEEDKVALSLELPDAVVSGVRVEHDVAHAEGDTAGEEVLDAH